MNDGLDSFCGLHHRFGTIPAMSERRRIDADLLDQSSRGSITGWLLLAVGSFLVGASSFVLSDALGLLCLIGWAATWRHEESPTWIGAWIAAIALTACVAWTEIYFR